MEIAFGECHCGCKEKTKLASQTSVKRGVVAGQPNRYISGHQNFQERAILVQPEDPLIRYIPLTQGQFAIVNADIYEWLMQWRWLAVYDPKIGGYYAQRGLPDNQDLKMHNAILPPPEGKITDHISGETLDNRRENLRSATNRQNVINTKLRKDNTSGHKGLSWDAKRETYQVHITVNGIQINLGRRKVFEEGKALYLEAAAKLHGDFVRKA